MKKDLNIAAKDIVGISVGLSPKPSFENKNNPGAHARADKLTPQQRSDIAKKAAKARWNK